MKNLLLPNRFKRLGWILFIPFGLFGTILLVTGIDAVQLELPVFSIYDEVIFGASGKFRIVKWDIVPTLTGIFTIAGALLIAFSSEHTEDEYIERLRQTSLQWAILVNYIILILAFLFIYGLPFFYILVVNMFTVLVFFIARFHWILWKNKRITDNDK